MERDERGSAGSRPSTADGGWSSTRRRGPRRRPSATDGLRLKEFRRPSRDHHAAAWAAFVLVIAAGGALTWHAVAARAPVAAGRARGSARTAGSIAAVAAGLPMPELTTAAVSPARSAAASAAVDLTPYSWARRYAVIAHGMGQIHGYTVTDSRDAFIANYDKGYRVFETDFVFTSDGALVARHDWSAASFARFGQRMPPSGVPTRARFMASPIHGDLAPLDAAGVVALMESHPDAWLVTDFKDEATSAHVRALRQLLAAAKGDPTVRERLIVQIYQESDLAPVRALGIRNVIYTFYRLKTSISRAVAFAAAHGVRVITMPTSMVTAALVSRARARGLICATHTVNEKSQAAEMRRRGISLIYTDHLLSL